jgi:estrogen-related receptor beta like 1
MAGDYKSQAEHTKGLTETYTKLNQSVQDLEAQYYEINEKLNSIQSRMDEHGKSLSDTSPLVKIKKAITQVKNDIRTIDIRIGVVSNTLMQSKLKEKNRSDSEAKGLNLGETEYDMEI